jgi:hypothetical protein
MELLDALEDLLGVKCGESRGIPMAARLCVLEIFAAHGSCLSYKDLSKYYGRGKKGHLKSVLKYLVEKGFIKVENERYCLTEKGLTIVKDPPPQCPKLFIAGADTALRVAVQSGIKLLNWLLSAGRYWRGGKFIKSMDFRLVKNLDGLLFLDSGAQQFFSGFKGFDYPYTAKEYLQLAMNIGADLIATLDLPLDILVPRGLSINDGIKRTVELGVEVVALAEDLGILYKVVPVLQGFNDLSQWLESLDLYKQHGITPDRFKLWGIGSICMMTKPTLVSKIIGGIRNAMPGAELHIFGISMNSLRRVFNLINSYDTSAWVYWAKKDGAVLIWSRRKMAFMHFQARDGKRYSTEDLMETNLKQLLEMHENLCLRTSSNLTLINNYEAIV